MAHTILAFYNVTSRVGGGQGRSLDVMLVQYMLFKVCINGQPHFSRVTSFTPAAPDVTGPKAIFPFTGIYTPELDKWIRKFQETANQRGYGSLTVDGMISPAPIGWGKRSIGKTGRWYTMQTLNVLLKEKADIPWNDVPNASDLSGVLGDQLRLIGLEDHMKVWVQPIVVCTRLLLPRAVADFSHLLISALTHSAPASRP